MDDRLPPSRGHDLKLFFCTPFRCWRTVAPLAGA